MIDADTCPKSMKFGPCGGVRVGGGCEVDGRNCPFVGPGAVGLPAVSAAPVGASGFDLTGVIVDVRAGTDWYGDRDALWTRTAVAVQGCTALLGEHVDNDVRESDAGTEGAEGAVAALRRQGVRTIVTITGRDRDLHAAGVRMAMLRRQGAVAIHCVTGDHPAGFGLERACRFGAESITLVESAVRLGSTSTVAESPASPGPRVERLIAKERAGASACILNQCGTVDEAVRFVDACAAAGATLRFVAPVPMVASVEAARSLMHFPGLHLPDGMLHAIARASDPFAEGVRWATDIGAAARASGRFAACNLSGRPPGRDPAERADSLHTFVKAVQSVWR